ncbi:hypothetical protein D3C73_1212670 [compost metagenome]
MEVVIIIRHRTQTDEPLHRVLQLDEHSEARHAADNPGEFFPDLIQHELGFLQLFRISLRVHGDPLPLGRLLRNLLHTTGQVFLPCFRQGPAMLNDLADDPVDHQIRIAADRGSKVRVEFRRQPEVTRAFGVILRLLHGPQHHRADDRLLLRALDILQQRLQRARMHLVAFSALNGITKIGYKSHEVH